MNERNQEVVRDVENNLILQDLLKEIDEHGRDLLFLYFVYEMSYPQIAQVLDISSETVGKRIRDALQLLRIALEEEKKYVT